MEVFVVSSDTATIYLAVINTLQTIALAVIAALSHRKSGTGSQQWSDDQSIEWDGVERRGVPKQEVPK